MTESGLFGSLERARKAADAVRAATEKSHRDSARDPENAPTVILAKATTKVVLDSIPVENPVIREALIRKAGEIAGGYESSAKPLPTPSGDATTTKRFKQL